MQALQPGDLLFFGNEEKCDHIGIYKGDGLYYHSSGKDFGRNGIGLDTLKKLMIKSHCIINLNLFRQEE